MPALVSILYPKGTNFNFDYYVNTHMPMVKSKWAAHGMTSFKVVKYENADTEGGEGQFLVQSILEFTTAEAYKAAAASPEAQEILADVSKFSDKQPLGMGGEVVGSG